MPQILGGFKAANVFDGMTDGVPFIAARPPLPPGSEREKLLAYLKQGELILRAAGLSVDQLDPTRGQQVPIIVFTDGVWVWDASVAYYLTEHDLPPEPAFLDYLRGRDFRYEAPAEERVDAALAAIQAE
ncbi:hypothetical protein [Frankia sp. ACN1ag]|uniref:hypothetical protein n=1 Tax=Frankia sp. ACN1ag TaxID=102891 RepID=UPI0006DCE8C9|nr:hypothetical protein [Frankia sp. ACN1ag]KQC39232.1 hypothetical protein UK82_06185 [Frankia sp. ACN1ag]